MAIIKCYECGADVSDQALTCPSCGAAQSKKAKAKAAKETKRQERLAYANSPAGKRKAKIMMLFVAALVVLVIVGRCAGNEQKQERQAAQQALTPEQKIAAGAVEKYTKVSHPKMHKAWGNDGLQRVNDLAPKAALVAAASRSCNRVDIVGLSSDRSKPPKQAVFFVDCANGERIYVDEVSITRNIAPPTESSKSAGINDGQAILMCADAVKAQLHNPLTFDRKALDTAVNRVKQSGNISVTFGFTAKNGLGAELPGKARCVIQPDGRGEASIGNQ